MRVRGGGQTAAVQPLAPCPPRIIIPGWVSSQDRGIGHIQVKREDAISALHRDPDLAAANDKMDGAATEDYIRKTGGGKRAETGSYPAAASRGLAVSLPEPHNSQPVASVLEKPRWTALSFIRKGGLRS